MRWLYCAAFVLLLGAEVWIALFVRDGFVRSYVGDVLVIVLLCCLARGPLGLRGAWLVPAVTGLGVLAECLQYFRLADRLGLASGSVLRVILGSTFDRADLLCYLAGGLISAAWERAERPSRRRVKKGRRFGEPRPAERKEAGADQRSGA